jgi:Ca2+-dependent lipid-binding protein
MSTPDNQHGPGGHYSGSNRVPNIKQFVERMDKDKAERDRQLDQAASHKPATNGARPHQDVKAGKSGTQRTVHDPTTQKEVQIEDVAPSFLKESKKNELSVPNANLEGRPVPLQTTADQSSEEYRHIQDITAPPDPVEPNSTSDVPIHGEKTNILFHPTPSVSYEPTFTRLEKHAWLVCGGVFAAVIFFGRLFGGRLIGLIPTAACVASGIWLWMKEVIRSGREVEWESEKNRGEHVSTDFPPR